MFLVILYFTYVCCSVFFQNIHALSSSSQLLHLKKSFKVLGEVSDAPPKSHLCGSGFRFFIPPRESEALDSVIRGLPPLRTGGRGRPSLYAVRSQGVQSDHASHFRKSHASQLGIRGLPPLRLHAVRSEGAVLLPLQPVRRQVSFPSSPRLHGVPSEDVTLPPLQPVRRQVAFPSSSRFHVVPSEDVALPLIQSVRRQASFPSSSRLHGVHSEDVVLPPLQSVRRQAPFPSSPRLHAVRSPNPFPSSSRLQSVRSPNLFPSSLRLHAVRSQDSSFKPFFMPTRICPLVKEKDGLGESSLVNKGGTMKDTEEAQLQQKETFLGERASRQRLNSFSMRELREKWKMLEEKKVKIKEMGNEKGRSSRDQVSKKMKAWKKAEQRYLEKSIADEGYPKLDLWEEESFRRIEDWRIKEERKIREKRKARRQSLKSGQFRHSLSRTPFERKELDLSLDACSEVEERISLVDAWEDEATFQYFNYREEEKKISIRICKQGIKNFQKKKDDMNRNYLEFLEKDKERNWQGFREEKRIFDKQQLLENMLREEEDERRALNNQIAMKLKSLGYTGENDVSLYRFTSFYDQERSVRFISVSTGFEKEIFRMYEDVVQEYVDNSNKKEYEATREYEVTKKWLEKIHERRKMLLLLFYQSFSTQEEAKHALKKDTQSSRIAAHIMAALHMSEDSLESMNRRGLWALQAHIKQNSAIGLSA